MDFLHKRQLTILFRLVEVGPETLTSQALANEIGVSARTIKKDIAELGNILIEQGASIEPKMGKGYQLTVYDEFLFNQLLMMQKLQEFNPVHKIPRYRYERINYIIKKLLAIDYHIRLENLADELYVSRSTITADLQEVREILSDFNLKILSKPNYGIILDGEELNKRLCISEYYFHSDVSTGFFAADNAMFISNSNQLEISIINNILIQVIRDFNLNISDFSVQNLVIHIVIAIRRWRFYNYVKMTPDRIEHYRKYREFPAANRLKEELEKWLNIILPIDEAFYLMLHLHSKHVNELNELGKDEISLVEKTLFEIYSMLRNQFNFITLDKNQYEMYIRQHIIVMVERLRTGMVIRNPQTYKILGKYPLATYLTLFVSQIIKETFKVEMNINEFSYLVLYTNLLISNSNRIKTKILLVCYQGRPEMITLLNELNENMSSLHQNIEICDYYMLETKKMSDYSLLITTIPLSTSFDIPTVYISDASPYWLQIQKAISDVVIAPVLAEDIIKPNFFMNHLKATDRDEVLRKISHLFDKQSSHVYKALWAGEQQMCLETSNNIVLLHTNELVVDEDFILIATFKKPIIWKRQWTQTVIWVNSSDCDILKLMGYYRLVNGMIKVDNLSQKLLNLNDFSELLVFVDGLN